jgi:hypothetical protein
MRAAVYTRYGPPDAIQIKDIAKPIPKDNEVLIKVRAVFDCIGNHSLSACSRVLNPKGIHITVGDKSGRAMIGMVSRHGMPLAGSGAVMGLLLCLTVSKPTAALVGGRGFNWPLVALVALILLGMAALGAYLPARRASQVDPNIVLRQE